MTASTLPGSADPSVALFAISEHVDSKIVAELQRRIAVSRGAGQREFVIDLSGVSAIDTAALAKLCAVLRGAADGGVGVAVVAADPRVQWVLELCAIDELALHRSAHGAAAQARLRQIWLACSAHPTRRGAASPGR